MTKSTKSNETCKRYIVRKGICGKPSWQTFIFDNHNGHKVYVPLCEKHSGDEGVKRVK